jgi:hypothetical protein
LPVGPPHHPFCYVLVVSADDAEHFLIERLIAGRAALDEIESWVEGHLRPGR